MVVLIGAGHVAYGLGAQRQAALWFDGASASVIPIPVLDEKDRAVKVRASYADFVWGVPKETDPPYPVLGLSTRDPKDGSEGWPVIDVAKDSVAEAAGFKVGDLLLSMDGTSLKVKGTFNRLMAEKRWSDTAAFEVKRGEEQVDAPREIRADSAGDAEGRGREEVRAGRSRTTAGAVLLGGVVLGANARRRPGLAQGRRHPPPRAGRSPRRPSPATSTSRSSLLRALSASRPASPSPRGRRRSSS